MPSSNVCSTPVGLWASTVGAWWLIVAAALAWVCGPAHGQENTTKFRVGADSFVYARLATHSSAALYAVSDLGRVALVAAMVQNPRTGYREVLGGLLSTVSYGGHSVTLAMAYADALDAPYIQAYVLPSLQHGDFSMDAVIEWYEPLRATGTRQLYANPVLVLARIHRLLSLGGSYVFGVEVRGPTTHAAGPAVELMAPLGTVTVEWLRSIDRANSEFRISLTMGY